MSPAERKAAMLAGSHRGGQSNRQQRLEGLAFAKAWRERNRERFDRLEAEGFYPMPLAPDWPVGETAR